VAPRGSREFLRQAVVDGGGTVVDDVAAAEALVWTAPSDARGLRGLLAANPQLSWVQLPWAGIEGYLDVLDHRRLWTAGQGVYADDVAEHVLALTLAGLRDLKRRALATSWQRPSGRSLHGAHVVVFGAGGITRALVPLLAPFQVRFTIVRKTPAPFALVPEARVVSLADRAEAVRDADVVVVALALTPETRGCIGAGELAAMKSTTWVVNVARGAHVDTAALVDALERGVIGGAAVDVTDPEPLPDGHPLFTLPNAIVTPHCANTPEMAVPVLTARVRENVRRRIAGEPLLGVVDVDAGY
jgi:phosphoglycerate dehydrogenase-like enzyme